MAFIIIGIPGTVLAFLSFRLTNPVRGINETASKETKPEIESDRSTKSHERLLTLDSNNNSAAAADGSSKSTEKFSWDEYWADFKYLVQIKPYIIANIGLAALNFCLGGLSSWYM